MIGKIALWKAMSAIDDFETSVRIDSFKQDSEATRSRNWLDSQLLKQTA
jgi:hypothetical protein